MSRVANRQPHIQGLRAIAVLVVVLFHAGLPVPGGFIGVDVFFVISGYVITAMLARELAAKGRVDFARFYVRRFKRLTPALALTVLATVVASALVLSPLGPQQQAANTAVGSMVLAANWVIADSTGGYFDAAAANNPLLNIWSLSVEEQFYLGFPLLMFLAWAWSRRTGRPSHLRLVVLIVGILSFALAVHGSAQPNAAFAVGFYSPFTRAWEFAAGALLALAPQPRWTRQGAMVVSSAGAGLLAFSLWEISGSTPFPSAWTLLPVAASVFLISAGGRRRTLVGDLLAARPMVAVGDWSYSIYLWHWPTIALAGVLLPEVPHVAVWAAVVSVVPALLSYRFLEEPIRNRDLPPRRLLLVVAVTLLVPISAAVGLRHLADTVWKPRAEQAAPVGARALHAGYAEGCHFQPGDGNHDPVPCVWHAEQSGRPVYLLGDSNAAQYVEALIDATGQQHRMLTTTTTSGCPLLDIEMEGPDFPGYGRTCLARNQRLLAWMARATPGTVVLGASPEYWYDPGWTVTLPNGSTTSDHLRMVEAMQASLQRVVRSLQRDGHDVVLVQPIPHWVAPHAWDPSRCTLRSALRGCAQRMPAADERARTAAVRAAITAVAQATGARTLDVTPQVCPDGTCATVRGALPVYRDATHITVAMSHLLAPQFAAAISAR